MHKREHTHEKAKTTQDSGMHRKGNHFSEVDGAETPAAPSADSARYNLRVKHTRKDVYSGLPRGRILETTWSDKWYLDALFTKMTHLSLELAARSAGRVYIYVIIYICYNTL